MADKKEETKKYKLIGRAHVMSVDGKLTKFGKGAILELTDSQAKSLVNKVEALDEKAEQAKPVKPDKPKEPATKGK